MNLRNIREQFPILENGSIYFDSASTSLTPNIVIDKMVDYYKNYNANIGRGVYRFSEKASFEYEKAHNKVADFLKVYNNEVIFVKNSTEGLNIVASGLKFNKEDRIVNTLIDHHSNYITWLRLKDKLGLNITHIKPDSNGSFDLNNFEKSIDENTKIVSLTHISNVLGSITPVEEIIKIAHENNCLVLVDGAQSAPHIPLDLKKMDCDFFVCSGHKMLGPGGTGVLYIKKDLQKEIEPLLIGGGTVTDVSLNEYSLKEDYERFEAGTPNIEGFIGLGAAVDYLNSIGMRNIKKHEQKLISIVLEELMELPEIEIFGPEQIENRSSLICFNYKGVNPHKVAKIFDEQYNILMRSGHHCCYPLIKHVINKPEGTLRCSLYLYNTEEEIKIFINAAKKISKRLT